MQDKLRDRAAPSLVGAHTDRLAAAVSWTSPAQRWTVYLLIAFCALAVRFGYWAQIHGTPLDEWHVWDQSDMATFIEQARRLAAGDWLARDPYHPYHRWQEEAASEEKWLHWYGPFSFHQAPLYSYGLAVLSKLRTDYLPLAKGLQLALGAGTCVLLAHLAARVGGVAVALVAGLVMTLYGPLFYLESQLLREGPAVFWFLLIVWATIRHAELPSGTPGQRLATSAALLGLLLGAYALFYENATVLALAAASTVLVHGARSSPRLAVAALAALAAGYGIGFAPMVARNAVVGAPLWTASSRLGINLAYSNMSSAADGGATFSFPGPQLAEIMDASDGTPWKIGREVWRGYEGQRGRFFANWAHRFRAIWAATELPDNTSFGFYRRHSSILDASLSFRWIFPGAVAVWLAWSAGWLMSRRGRKPRERSDRFSIVSWFGEHAGAHATLISFTLLLVLAMSVVPPQARYRLFLVPAFILYTSFALVAAARWIGSHRVVPAVGLGATALAAAGFHVWLSEPRIDAEDRYVDYTVVASIYRKRGNEDAAAEYSRRRVIGPSTLRSRERAAPRGRTARPDRVRAPRADSPRCWTRIRRRSSSLDRLAAVLRSR